MTQTAFARWVAVAASAFFVVFGVWAFADAASFYDNIATFPPYNEHFLHDVGAFQIGLGAVLALAVAGWPSLAATLGGVAAGSVLHAAAHIIDRDHGGRDTDPWGAWPVCGGCPGGSGGGSTSTLVALVIGR